MAFDAHQRRIEKFREKRRIALIVRKRIHKIFELLKKFVHGFQRAHLPLHTTDARRGARASKEGALLGLVIKIVPLQQRGVAVGGRVFRKIGLEQALDLEIIGELKAQNGVVYFLFLDLFDVLFW